MGYQTSLTRRGFVGVSGATTLGALTLAYQNSLVAEERDEVEYLSRMIFVSVPDAVKHPTIVKTFVVKLLGGQLQSLESQEYIWQQLQAQDHKELAIYLVFEFICHHGSLLG